MGRIQDGQSSGSTNHAADAARANRKKAGLATSLKHTNGATIRNADGSGVLGEDRIGGIIKELGLGHKLGKGSKAVKQAYETNMHSLSPVGSQKQFKGTTAGYQTAHKKDGFDWNSKSDWSHLIDGAIHKENQVAMASPGFLKSMVTEPISAARRFPGEWAHSANVVGHDMDFGYNFNEGDKLIAREKGGMMADDPAERERAKQGLTDEFTLATTLFGGGGAKHLLKKPVQEGAEDIAPALAESLFGPRPGAFANAPDASAGARSINHMEAYRRANPHLFEDGWDEAQQLTRDLLEDEARRSQGRLF